MKLGTVTLWIKVSDMTRGVTVTVSFDVISAKADIKEDATNAQSNEHRVPRPVLQALEKARFEHMRQSNITKNTARRKKSVLKSQLIPVRE
jgi:hypothetical protein